MLLNLFCSSRAKLADVHGRSSSSEQQATLHLDYRTEDYGLDSTFSPSPPLYDIEAYIVQRLGLFGGTSTARFRKHRFRSGHGMHKAPLGC
jgi:hypothetical protein